MALRLAIVSLWVVMSHVAAKGSIPSFRGAVGNNVELNVTSVVSFGDGRCHSLKQPINSKCIGCPPMHDGKFCATTTWYEDKTKGSCGCGAKEIVDDDHWTLNSFTAALNAVNLDPENPALTYCLSGCGSCFKLCTTGGVVNSLDTRTASDQCEIFRITNRCADGWEQGFPDWCSQHMSWQACQANPNKCHQDGGTNIYGYSAHFDLQNSHGQVLRNLGWTNPEVTFEPVSCDLWTGPSHVLCPGCEL